jgi:hypothetical protein
VSGSVAVLPRRKSQPRAGVRPRDYPTGQSAGRGGRSRGRNLKQVLQKNHHARVKTKPVFLSLHFTFLFSYDCVNKCVPDAFSHLLEEIHRLETELGHLPQKWKVLWDKLELPTTDSLTVTLAQIFPSLFHSFFCRGTLRLARL